MSERREITLEVGEAEFTFDLTPQDVMKKGYEVAFDLYATESNRNPVFKKIYDHWSAFRSSAYRWYSLNETPMDVFVGNAIARGRKS